MASRIKFEDFRTILTLCLLIGISACVFAPKKVVSQNSFEEEIATHPIREIGYWSGVSAFSYGNIHLFYPRREVVEYINKIHLANGDVGTASEGSFSKKIWRELAR